MDLMGDAVSRLAEMDAVPGAGALQEAVIVGVAKVGLEQVVVDILRGQVDSDPGEP